MKNLNKSDLDKLNKILNQLKIKKGQNIYLSIDITRLALALNLHRKNMKNFSINIINLLIKKIGKNGNLAIPVFNESSISKLYFSRKDSAGESGAFGNLLLQKYYLNRSKHPYVSYLFFGKDSKKFINIDNMNSEDDGSPWSEIINKNFTMITIGHHYQRAFSIIHYLERIANVKYRYDKYFTIRYLDFNNKIIKKKFSFFARKLNKCKFSSITTYCDKFFIKHKIATLVKSKRLISYKVNLNLASDIILKDLRKGSSKFVCCATKLNSIKNKKILYGKNITKLEII